MKPIPLKFAAFELLGLGLHTGVPVMPAGSGAIRPAEYQTHPRFFPIEEDPSAAGFEPTEIPAVTLPTFRKTLGEAH
jgi:hypothetical protein